MSYSASSFDSDVDLHPLSSRHPSLVTVNKWELEDFYKIVQCAYRKEEENTQLVQENLRLKQELSEEIDRHEQEIAQLRFDQEQAKAADSGQCCAHERAVYAEAQLNCVHKDMQQTFLKFQEENRILSEHVKSLAELKGSSKREKELEDKLKHVEAMYDFLMIQKNTIEQKYEKAMQKLQILGAFFTAESDLDSIKIKQLGRFEIKTRKIECSRCHETFSSKDEMSQSTCHYHSAPPLPEITADGTRNFWRCCNRSSGRNRILPGCQHGEHTLSKKRQRTRWTSAET